MNDQNILYVIADIAHGGGLANMSAEDALIEIRQLTKAFWKRNRSPNAIKNDIMCGLMMEKSEDKPRITEDDAREIIEEWMQYNSDCGELLPNFEWFAPEWKKLLNELLDKLNRVK